MPPARPLVRTLCIVACVIVGAGRLADDAAANPGDRRFKDEEIVREGLAVASFRGIPFRSGTLVLRANGSGSGQIYYGDRRLSQATIHIDWQERARGGSPPRPMEPGGYDPREWWHPTHRVKVRASDTDTRDALDADDLRLLSKQIADKLSARALLWEPLYRQLRLEPELDGYRLVNSHKGRINTPDEQVELTYQVPLPDGLSRAERLRRYRAFELRIAWFAIGHPPRDKAVWKLSHAHVDDASFDYLVSKTHYVKLTVWGEHWTDEAKFKMKFRNPTHRQAARRIAKTIMQRFESRLAAPRAGEPQRSSGGGLVVKRPSESEKADRPSGRILRMAGGVVVMRNQRRVALRSGGEVQLGDTILTSGTGTIEIRFDDPAGGPAQDGRLTIGPGSKVTIDVGPYRPKSEARPTRIRVDEGAVRFDRPHHHQNARFELGIPGDTAIFGLHGTDAVLYRAADRYVLALADGMGDLAIHGKHGRVLTPIHAYEVGFDGRDLGEIEVTRAWYEKIVRGLAPKPAPDGDLEQLLGGDLADPESPGREWIVGSWVSLRSTPRRTLKADVDGALQYVADDDKAIRYGTWSKSGERVYRFEIQRIGQRRLHPVQVGTARLVGFELEVTFPNGKVERFDQDTGSIKNLPPFDEEFIRRPPFVGLWHAVVPDLPLQLDIRIDGTLTYWDNRRPDVLISGTWKRADGGHAFTFDARNGKRLNPPLRLTVTVNKGQLQVTLPDGKPARFKRAKPPTVR